MCAINGRTNCNESSQDNENYENAENDGTLETFGTCCDYYMRKTKMYILWLGNHVVDDIQVRTI